MLGLFITLLFSFVATFAGLGYLSRFSLELDPAEKIGFAGLVSLVVAGTIIGLGGLVLGRLYWVLLIPYFGFGGWLAYRQGLLQIFKFEKPEGTGLAFVAGLGLLFVFPLLGVLTPSTSLDWDSIAYHLSVPKIWLQTGDFSPLIWEHHSYFPAGIDALFVPGLSYGDQSGAKGFLFVALVLSCLAVFGGARRCFGAKFAAWAPLVLAGAPVVLWESGTAYIDVPHGVLAAMGIWYLGDAILRSRGGEESIDNWIVLGSIGLAGAMGTKFTGLQTFLAAGLVWLVMMIRARGPMLRGVVLSLVIVLVVGGGWYVRNMVDSGNPVRPFFSSVFETRGWDKWRADTYSHEQKTFGVGTEESRRSVGQAGNAVFGLAVQPGRFVNPAQTVGGGFPFGALGVASLMILAAAALGGKLGVRERAVMSWLGVILVMWFFLSQQSRYMTFVCASAALLLPLVMTRWRIVGQFLAGVVVVQAMYTAWMLYTVQGKAQLDVVFGKVLAQDYLEGSTPFARAAKSMNANPTIKHVALFDEVFGFYLDHSYHWANPAHTTLNSVKEVDSGAEYVRNMYNNPSHIYINLQFMSPEDREKFFSAAGLSRSEGYSESEREAMFGNEDLKWRWLLADAVKSGALTVEESFRTGVLFKVEP